MAKQKSPTRPQVTGNPIAQNPLLRKGGAHQKSNSAKRKNAKRELQRAVRAWRTISFCRCVTLIVV